MNQKKEFRNLGFQVKIATEDGSEGYKGFVTGLLQNMLNTHDSILPAFGGIPPRRSRRRDNTNIYACGPKEMFLKIHKVVKKFSNIKCQVSFEQFMGCGLGICCACVIPTKKGYKKVCKDGPVFDLSDIF